MHLGEGLSDLREHSGESMVSLIDELVKRYPGLPQLMEAHEHQRCLLEAARRLDLKEASRKRA